MKRWLENRETDPHHTFKECEDSFPEVEFVAVPGGWKKPPPGKKYGPGKWLTLTDREVEFLGVGYLSTHQWTVLKFDGRSAQGRELSDRLNRGSRHGALITKPRPCDKLPPDERLIRCRDQCSSRICPKSRFYRVPMVRHAPIKPKGPRPSNGYIPQGGEAQPETRPHVGGSAGWV